MYSLTLNILQIDWPLPILFKFSPFVNHGNGCPVSLSRLVRPPSHPFSNSQCNPHKHRFFVKTCILKNLLIVLKMKVKYLSMMAKTLNNLALALSPDFCAQSVLKHFPQNLILFDPPWLLSVFFLWLKHPFFLHQNRGKLILVLQTQLMLYLSCGDSKTSPGQNPLYKDYNLCILQLLSFLYLSFKMCHNRDLPNVLSCLT